MRASIEEHPKDFFTVQWGGISRCCKCDDDLTILEVIYEDNEQTQSSNPI